MANNAFESTFKTWKISLAICFSLSFAIYFLYSSLNQVQFVETKAGEGTHIWKDYNNDKQLDKTDIQEFVLAKEGDYRQKTMVELLQEIPWTTQTFIWLSLALLFMVGRDLAYMWRIRILTKNHLTWKSSFNVIMLWEFASALSPGVVSGSAVAMFILNKEKIALGKSTAIILITTMMDNLFYIACIPCVFLFIEPSYLFPTETTLDKSVAAVFWTAYIIFLSLFLILFTSIFFYPKMVKSILSLLFQFKPLKRWREEALKTGNEVEQTALAFRQEPTSFWLKSFVATCFSWTSRFLVINCVAAAFLNLNHFNHIFIFGKQFVLWLFMRISPTPGGSGVAEYAFGELLADFGATALLLAGMAILWRLISYFTYLFIGAIVLPAWLKRTRG